MNLNSDPSLLRKKPYSDLAGFRISAASSSERLRKLMLRAGFTFCCSRCGITEWLGEPAPLQIDHIDGDRMNNLRSNLRFLCPNCHALTETFGSRNRSRARRAAIENAAVAVYDELVSEHINPSLTAILGRVGFKPKYAEDRATVEAVLNPTGRELWSASTFTPRPSAEKIRWPSDEKLTELLRTMSRVELGEKLGVSDTAIKKRCKVRGIAEPMVRRSRKRKVTSAPKNRSAEEQAEARKTRRLKRLATIHGTRSGYLLEIRLGLDTCEACRTANAEDAKQRRAASPTTEPAPRRPREHEGAPDGVQGHPGQSWRTDHR